jgi:hypothetical protein
VQGKREKRKAAARKGASKDTLRDKIEGSSGGDAGVGDPDGVHPCERGGVGLAGNVVVEGDEPSGAVGEREQ